MKNTIVSLFLCFSFCWMSEIRSDIENELITAVNNSWDWPALHFTLYHDQFESAKILLELFPESAKLKSPATKVMVFTDKISDSPDEHRLVGTEEGVTALELALIKKQSEIALTILHLTNGEHSNVLRKELKGKYLDYWIKLDGFGHHTVKVPERIKEIKSKDNFTETSPLYWAILSQDLNIVQALLDLNVDLNCIYTDNNFRTSAKKYSALDVAAKFGDKEILRKILFAQGRRFTNTLPSEEEISEENLNRLQLLGEKNETTSLLFQAILDDDIEDFAFLLSYGTKTLDKNPKTNKTLFCMALEQENPEFVNLLIEYTPDQSYLMDAFISDRIEILMQLLDLGLWDQKVLDESIRLKKDELSLLILSKADPEMIFLTMKKCVENDQLSFLKQIIEIYGVSAFQKKELIIISLHMSKADIYNYLRSVSSTTSELSNNLLYANRILSEFKHKNSRPRRCS